MHLEPHLDFNGRCEEALDFYKQAIGAKIEVLMRWKDSPDKSMCTPQNAEKVMHSRLQIGNASLMASDGRGTGKANFHGIMLSISTESEAEADRLFNGLATGGQVTMPQAKTFFSPRFGMVTDKFGVGWMILVAN